MYPLRSNFCRTWLDFLPNIVQCLVVRFSVIAVILKSKERDETFPISCDF